MPAIRRIPMSLPRPCRVNAVGSQATSNDDQCTDPNRRVPEQSAAGRWRRGRRSIFFRLRPGVDARGTVGRFEAVGGRRLIGRFDRARRRMEPDLQLRRVGKYPAALAARHPVHGQTALSLPALHGPHVAIEVRGDLFPRNEPLRAGCARILFDCIGGRSRIHLSRSRSQVVGSYVLLQGVSSSAFRALRPEMSHFALSRLLPVTPTNKND